MAISNHMYDEAEAVPDATDTPLSQTLNPVRRSMTVEYSVGYYPTLATFSFIDPPAYASFKGYCITAGRNYST